MNIIFAGTPDFAADSLRAILQKQHSVIAVYTQPDRPAGRGKKLLKSAVKVVAESFSIPVYQPEKLTDPAAQQQLAALKPDLMIVAAYGLLLPAAVLTIPKLGCVNIHASLLPRWRGAAPIQRAIQAGDRQTGITIMQMDEGLDTGAMISKWITEISPQDTGGSLHDRLSQLGATAILDYLEHLNDRSLVPEPQDSSLACYARKLNKAEAEINWSDDAQQTALNIRAFNPWPVAFLKLGEEPIRVFEAQVIPERSTTKPGSIIAKTKHGIDVRCGNNALRITRLQLPGAKAISAEEFFNGGKPLLEVGSCLAKP